jgi:hypothetical protein
MPGRISRATFLHLKTNEPPEDRALSLTAILADPINLGLVKMAEVCNCSRNGFSSSFARSSSETTLFGYSSQEVARILMVLFVPLLECNH